MLSEGIIIAIITGGFAIVGTIIQTYKCSISKCRNLSLPYAELNVRYEPPNLKNQDKYIKIKNGKYRIKVPPCLRMHPCGTGTVNIYKEFFENYGECNLELKLSNIKGDVDLFVKRFDKDWNFVENGSITTQPAINGYNKMRITSRIGQNDVVFEQIGVMVYSEQNEYLYRCNRKITNIASCNVNGAKIEYL